MRAPAAASSREASPMALRVVVIVLLPWSRPGPPGDDGVCSLAPGAGALGSQGTAPAIPGGPVSTIRRTAGDAGTLHTSTAPRTLSELPVRCFEHDKYYSARRRSRSRQAATTACQSRPEPVPVRCRLVSAGSGGVGEISARSHPLAPACTVAGVPEEPGAPAITFVPLCRPRAQAADVVVGPLLPS